MHCELDADSAGQLNRNAPSQDIHECVIDSSA